MSEKEAFPPQWSKNLDIEILRKKTELEWVKIKQRLQKTLKSKSET